MFRALTHWIKIHDLHIFFGLTFFIAWGIWIPVILSLPPEESGPLPGRALLLASLGIFAPTLAAILTTAITQGRAGLTDLFARLFRWWAPARWYLVILVGVPAIFGLAMLVYTQVMGQSVSFDASRWAAIFPILFFGLLGGPLGEELGWRGFALPRLQQHWNPINASILLGITWAFWHLPEFIWQVKGFSPSVPFYNFLISAVAFSILITWVFNHTRGSVFIAIVFHLWINSVSNYILTLFSPADPGGLMMVKNWMVATAALGVVIFYSYPNLIANPFKRWYRRETKGIA